MSTKSLIKPIGINSAGIAISRALGFVRLILLASLFGTGSLIQAFIVAFRIPNLLRQLVGEGATNPVFVPVLSEYLATKDKKEFWRLANALFSFLSAALAVLVIAGIAAAPFIVRVIAPGFTVNPDQLHLTVRLTRIMFPYIFLIGIAALASGILNSMNHFAVPAFTSSLLNISLVAAMLLFYRSINVYILAGAVLVGGVLQVAFQVPALRGKGMKLDWPMRFRHPAAKKIGLLLMPRVYGSAVHQLNSMVDTMLASFQRVVGAGAIAALWYSYLLIQFPTAIFGHAVAIAALPALSGHFAKNERDEFKKTILFSMKSVFLFMIPAAVGFMIMGSPIIKVLFQRGQFDSYSSMITNQALFFYSIGLFSYAGIKVLAFGFYSMRDTMTPVKIATAALFINIVLNLALMHPLKVGGIALATSIAGIFNFSALFYFLRKKIGALNEKDMLIFLGKTAAAGVFMGGILYFLLSNALVKQIFGQGGLLLKITVLAALIAAGGLFYGLALVLLRVREIKALLKWIRKY